MQKLISIIIPVYNASQYLDKCLSSIVSQSYRNLEILLVDDGSKDDSLRKCYEWKDKDSRINVFHKKNGGQGSARNVALDNAIGNYIGFVDSDDVIKSDMYEVLLDLLESNDADMVISRAENFYHDDDLVDDGDDTTVVMSSVEAMQDRFTRSRFITDSPCNKLYKSSLFEKIRFLENRLLEDSAFMYKVIYQCHTIAYINKTGYLIRCDLSSVSRRKYNIRRCDMITTYEEIASFFSDKEEYRFLLSKMQSYANGAVFYNAGEFYCSNCKDQQSKQFIMNHAKFQHSHYQLKSPKNSFLLLLISHCFTLYGIMYEFKKRLRRKKRVAYFNYRSKRLHWQKSD